MPKHRDPRLRQGRSPSPGRNSVRNQPHWPYQLPSQSVMPYASGGSSPESLWSGDGSSTAATSHCSRLAAAINQPSADAQQYDHAPADIAFFSHSVAELMIAGVPLKAYTASCDVAGAKSGTDGLNQSPVSLSSFRDTSMSKKTAAPDCAHALSPSNHQSAALKLPPVVHNDARHAWSATAAAEISAALAEFLDGFSQPAATYVRDEHPHATHLPHDMVHNQCPQHIQPQSNWQPSSSHQADRRQNNYPLFSSPQLPLPPKLLESQVLGLPLSAPSHIRHPFSYQHDAAHLLLPVAPLQTQLRPEPLTQAVPGRFQTSTEQMQHLQPPAVDEQAHSGGGNDCSSAPAEEEIRRSQDDMVLMVSPETRLLLPSEELQSATAPATPAAADKTSLKRKKVRRARILKEGSLTLIPYGSNERLQWMQRIMQFIQQVRGVLGDRRFSEPWGGSVLDSIIGTFLTQNVADQLSSQAWMTLAATFPAKPHLPQKPSNATPASDPSSGCCLASDRATPVRAPSDRAPPTKAPSDSALLDGNPSDSTPPGKAASHRAPSASAPQARVPSDRTPPVKPLQGRPPSVFANCSEPCSGTACEPPMQGTAQASAVDWEAVRVAPAAQVAGAIHCRGMHNRLTDSIQAFLNRLHSSTAASRVHTSNPLAMQQPLLATGSTAQLQDVQEQRLFPVSPELAETVSLPDTLEPHQTLVKGQSQTPVHSLTPSSPQTPSQVMFEDPRQYPSPSTHQANGLFQNPPGSRTLPQSDLIPAQIVSALDHWQAGEAASDCVKTGVLDTGMPQSGLRSQVSYHAYLEQHSQGPLSMQQVELSATPGLPYVHQEKSAGQTHAQADELLVPEAQQASRTSAADKRSGRNLNKAGSHVETRRQNSQAEPGGVAATSAANGRQLLASRPEQHAGATAEMLGAYSRVTTNVKVAEAAASDCGTRGAGAGLDLEWLRTVPPDQAKEYLMGVAGLGRKSVACIMLLCLGMSEFPVDVNVGRICSRLGWIPLDAEQALEDVDKYAPETEVHKYLSSRLACFDIATLYELHYQMITLGKVFCSKVSPNCGACPLQMNCDYARNNGKRYGTKAGYSVHDLEDLAHPVSPTRDRQYTPAATSPAATLSATKQAVAAAPAEPAGHAEPAEPSIQNRTCGVEAAADHAEPGLQMASHALPAAGERVEAGVEAKPELLQALGSQQQEVTRLLQAAASMREAELSTATEQSGRPLAIAYAALGALDIATQGWAAPIPLSADADTAMLPAVKKRMKILSMLVHPDKCSMPGTKEAFAALHHAYSLIQQHHHQPEQQMEEEAAPRQRAEQPAASSSNRLLLTAFEVPETCWRLLPEHLQAHARGVPCSIPFLALPLVGPGPNDCHGPESDMQLEPMNPTEPNTKSDDAQHNQASTLDDGRVNHNNEWTSQHQHPPELVSSQQSLDLRHDAYADTVHKSSLAGDPTAAGLMSMSGDGMTATPAGKACPAGTASTVMKPQLKEATALQQAQAEHPGNVDMQEGSSLSSKIQMALLVPCRKAVQNCFPLNGTFFQVNEVFLDQDTMLRPIEVNRLDVGTWQAQQVYTGASAASICRGMRQAEVAHLFNHACICVRAYSSSTGMPGALPAWLLPGTPPKKKRQMSTARVAETGKQVSMTFAAESPVCTQGPSHLAMPHHTAGSDTGGADSSATAEVPNLALGPQLAQHNIEGRGIPAPAAITPARSLQQASSAAAPLNGKTAHSMGSMQAVALHTKMKRPAKHVNHPKAGLHESVQAVLPYKLVKPASGMDKQIMAAVAEQSVGHQTGPLLLEKRRLAMAHKHGKPPKRVQLYVSVKAADRCGQCATCLKRSMKKACLVVRRQMMAAALVDAESVQQTSI